mgnify:CR=1 FL=1
MNIVEKYGGTSVGTIEQIQAIALHAKHMKEQGHNLSLLPVPWEKPQIN